MVVTVVFVMCSPKGNGHRKHSQLVSCRISLVPSATLIFAVYAEMDTMTATTIDMGIRLIKQDVEATACSSTQYCPF